MVRDSLGNALLANSRLYGSSCHNACTKSARPCRPQQSRTWKRVSMREGATTENSIGLQLLSLASHPSTHLPRRHVLGNKKPLQNARDPSTRKATPHQATQAGLYIYIYIYMCVYIHNATEKRISCICVTLFKAYALNNPNGSVPHSPYRPRHNLSLRRRLSDV